eukprot:TRINITY_DN2314_c0_g1_i2.p2 TRINITY_DN2314_c0_g1~~TRINITY_DN2314_c0_g1_i2.p2  ORF type:complete len:247 (+),score=31.30 TRINITY_DN2314_c0_g1_i2:1127-1867(+)
MDIVPPLKSSQKKDDEVEDEDKMMMSTPRKTYDEEITKNYKKLSDMNYSYAVKTHQHHKRALERLKKRCEYENDLKIVSINKMYEKQMDEKSKELFIVRAEKQNLFTEINELKKTNTLLNEQISELRCASTPSSISPRDNFHIPSELWSALSFPALEIGACVIATVTYNQQFQILSPHHPHIYIDEKDPFKRAGLRKFKNLLCKVLSIRHQNPEKDNFLHLPEKTHVLLCTVSIIGYFRSDSLSLF